MNSYLDREVSLSQVRPALGRLLRRWETGPDRRLSVRLLLEAVHRLPPDPILQHLETCRVGRILPSASDVTVVLLESPAGDGPFIARIASGGNDCPAIQRNSEALTQLATDDRIPHLRVWLPVQVCLGSAGGRMFAVEEALPGQRAQLWGSRPRSLPAVARLAITAIHQLHEATGETQILDEDLLLGLLDEPLRALGRAQPQMLAASSDAVVRLRSQVGLLVGQGVQVSWTHGDFWLGNLLTRAGGQEISGIVDWDAARPDGLAAMDLYHFLLTTRATLGRRELGLVVADMLRGEQWTDEEASLLAGANEQLSAEGDMQRALLLLTWLNHVSAAAGKRVKYGVASRWASRNIKPVLQSL